MNGEGTAPELGRDTAAAAGARAIARRRMLAGGAALAAGALGAATGCAGAGTPAPAVSTEPAQLSLLWVTRPGEELLWSDEFPRLLSRQHPHIRTTMEMVPASGDYWGGLLTKVVSLTAAGTPPDASRNAGFNARQLRQNGLLKDLAGYP